MPLPAHWDAPRIGDAYGEWLTRKFRGALHVSRDGEGARLLATGGGSEVRR